MAAGGRKVTGRVIIPVIPIAFRNSPPPYPSSSYQELFFSPVAVGRPYTLKTFYEQLSNGNITVDGAVLVTIAGGPVDSVEAAGYSVYLARIDPSTVRVIVAGDLTSGTIAHIHIPDHRRLSQYSATINQVAARTSYRQRSPAAYALTLTP
jgi:hypothetical protein